MMSMSVKQCCCGCSLRTGSLILFWLSLISESYFFLVGLLAKAATSTHPVRASGSPKHEEGLEILDVIGSVVFITNIICLILCVCGLIGIYKNVPRYLTLGVYYFGIRLVCCIVLVLMLIFLPFVILQFVQGGGKEIGETEKAALTVVIIICVAFGLLASALQWYFFVVVKSYRDAMKKGIADRGTNNKTLDGTALAYHYTA